MNKSPSLYEQCLELAKQNQRDCPCNANERLVEDLEAAIAEQAEPQEPIGYLCKATRFKLSFGTDGSETSLSQFKDELQGKWVALVDATDGKHLTHPQTDEPQDFDKLAKLGWQAIECSLCGSSAMAFPVAQALEPMSQEELATLRLRAALYEHIRKFSVSKFQKFFIRNIQGEGRFDDLVYADMQANKEVGANA